MIASAAHFVTGIQFILLAIPLVAAGYGLARAVDAWRQVEADRRHLAAEDRRQAAVRRATRPRSIP